MKTSKKGFTLIELIVVLAILAVIAAIAVPTAFGAIDKAKFAADAASVEAYNSAIRIQGTLLSAGTIDPAENTVGKAIENAQMSDTKVQYSKSVVTWVPATPTTMGNLTITDGGTGTAATVGFDWKRVITGLVAGKDSIVYVKTS